MTGPKTPSPAPKAMRRILYGRRKGRPLRAGRKRLLEELLPRVTVPAAAVGVEGPASESDGNGPALDPKAWFGGPSPISGGETAGPPREVWLEVGFGNGEHLAAQAGTHPDIGFIGCEPFINGVAALLARIKEHQLTNIRIFTDDARILMERLEDSSLVRVFVLFPDPWPKARHARRRFIAADTLDALARVMSDGAELRVATDDMLYLRSALAALIAHEAFDWCAEKAEDWRVRPPDQPATRYEEKARVKGLSPAFLVFKRRSRPAPGQAL